MSKSIHEIGVVLEFASIYKPIFDIDNVLSCRPPEPDVICKINKVTEYIEVARLLDPAIPKLRKRAIINSNKSPSEMIKINPFDVGLPERDILTSKLNKQYKLNSKALNLLLYYDTEDFLTFSAVSDFNFQGLAKIVLLPIIAKDPNKFKRIWFYDRSIKKIIWEYRQ